jgi:hypothetical protein
MTIVTASPQTTPDTVPTVRIKATGSFDLDAVVSMNK